MLKCLKKQLIDKLEVKELRKMVDCICGTIVPDPIHEKTGYGVVFTCFNCKSKYFAEMPEDALEVIQEIAESASKNVEDLEITKIENFDTFKENENDEFGDVYHLYFIKV